MFPRSCGSFAAALLALGALGCGSATGGAGPIDVGSRSYTADMGEMAYDALAGSLDPVLVDEYGYALRRREEQYSSLYYQTEWRSREPSEDEAARGVVEAQSRIIVRGVRSGVGYRVTFEGESRVRTRGSRDWRAMAVTGAFLVRMRAIRRALEEAARRGPGFLSARAG